MKVSALIVSTTIGFYDHQMISKCFFTRTESVPSIARLLIHTHSFSSSSNMFTASVLSSIKDPELRKTLHLDETDKEHDSQVVWLRDSFDNIGKAPDDKYGPDPANGSLQQSDLLRKFYLTIAEKGLKYAYDHSEFTPGDLPHGKLLSYEYFGSPVIMHFLQLTL